MIVVGYILKGTKIISIDNPRQTRKRVYNKAEELVKAIALKKIKCVSNRFKKDILPQLIEVQRFINALPTDERKEMTQLLEQRLGKITYKQQARHLS